MWIDSFESTTLFDGHLHVGICIGIYLEMLKLQSYNHFCIRIHLELQS